MERGQKENCSSGGRAGETKPTTELASRLPWVRSKWKESKFGWNCGFAALNIECLERNPACMWLAFTRAKEYYENKEEIPFLEIFPIKNANSEGKKRRIRFITVNSESSTCMGFLRALTKPFKEALDPISQFFLWSWKQQSDGDGGKWTHGWTWQIDKQ